MEEYTGTIDHFLFRNESNGYGVMELSTQDCDVICVGTIVGVEQGDLVKVTGEYVENSKYGVQFKVSGIMPILPTSRIGIERYLASGTIRGVGPKLAKRIVDRFGEDTLRVIEEEPELLTTVKGISERIAQEISIQLMSKKEHQDAMIFLAGYGISQILAIKMFQTYGDAIYSIIKSNPYAMIEDIEGFGFKKADDIALQSGIKIDSQERLGYGIRYSLSMWLSEGHTCLPKDELVTYSSNLLGVDEQTIEDMLPNLVIDRDIVIQKEDERENCYLGYIYNTELRIASRLRDIDQFRTDMTAEKMNAVLSQVEQELGVILDEKQREAVALSMQCGVLILTGGPGTGKTTTINAIIKCIERLDYEVMLAAPTGRAAKRMTEATNYEAKTIHRMLEFSGGSLEGGRRAHFERNDDNPLESDVFIIDEMSMVDTLLFSSLLRAIPEGGRLILVGDENQLPSVGAGQILKDLICSEAFSTIRLQNIFRQAKESDIVVNAHKINHGEHITLVSNGTDFLFLERDDPRVIRALIIKHIMGGLPKYVDSTPAAIQVLTPTHKGPLGVEALNKELQAAMNPRDSRKSEKEFGDVIFREGDKVMHIKNDYNLEWEVVGKNGILLDKGLGVFNGDMGLIVRISSVEGYVQVEFDDGRRVKYTNENLGELELAYAITIHKSQGSEYPAVVMPILSGPRQLFNRNLLYTGVTRAKKCVFILGSSTMVNAMIDNESENKRFTGLCMRIRELI